MDSEKEIARLIMQMSSEERGAFAAGLCAHLEGYYFVRDESDENMDDEHVLKAVMAWAEDELRTGS